ncbi:trypsin-like serine protease [Myxococcota bacterium]|nr:trypsin-like serine protease [Myxococcota bacterium]MBU1382551.1 trypsin-like serine protease [Myxococcota bacterium]MBU1497443.1 trypsin-like serine protease [Myxococcota bacterium]
MKKFLPLILVAFLFSACNEGNGGIIDIDGYILYGSPDTSSAHQAVVYISIDAGGGYGGACSGTLITSRHVLTAGHCAAAPQNLQVYFGNSVNTFYDARNVSVVTVHPQYNADNVTNDIAVLTLSQAAPTSITPIPALPPSLAITNSDVNSTPLQYVGFGVTETGSSGTKLTISRPPVAICDGSTVCNYNISGVGYTQMPPGTLGIRMDTDGGICSGDSGGPAFVVRNGTEYVAGVSSYVLLNSQEECDFFGVSTKVDKFSTFIGGITGAQYEDCGNGVDDDGDNLVDCNDPDCSSSEDCIVDACSMKTDISCGDSVNATTVGGGTGYSTYPSACTNSAAEAGPERVYRIAAPTGTIVTAMMSPASGSSDLDLLLVKGSCSPTSCVDGSLNNAGIAEQLTFTTDSNTHYLFVETYENPGSFTLTITCESSNPVAESCNNGIDDDKDGDTDCDDSDCENTAGCMGGDFEDCSNRFDDDSDGAIDCQDADCFFSPECTSRVEICDNYIDDDGDMKADCDDADCFNTALCNSLVETCDNGIDDDNNGDTDCNDVKCISHAHCAPAKEICLDGVDNDGDGFIDCQDADCQSSIHCPNIVGENCLNYADDDGDGRTDCDDPDCSSLTLCYYVSNYQRKDSKADPSCMCQFVGYTPARLPVWLLLLGLMIPARRFFIR